MMEQFVCYLVERRDEGTVVSGPKQCDAAELPPGEVLIRVAWSSLNYKDALAARGHPGVAKQLPHIPGVDIAGTVTESQDARFRPGQAVLACAYDLGAGRWGGWSQYARVPADWAMPLPRGLSLREAMVIGTAGFTSALCVRALQDHGVTPTSGEVVVTGASGGVGSIAVMLLGQLGYHVVAVTGKSDQADRLRRWGAAEVAARNAVLDASPKPLLSARWAGAVDTVGGQTLDTLVRQTKLHGCVAACGNASGPELKLTVFPFILRGVILAGVDAAWYPMPERRATWDRLATSWKPPYLEELAIETDLPHLDGYVESILRGEVAGRVVVKIQDESGTAPS